MFTSPCKHDLLYEMGILMDGIRKYLLGVICAAVICSVVNTLAGKKTAHGAIIRLISGLFMAITLISPLVNIKLTDYADYFNNFSIDADAAVASGAASATEELRSIIKSQTEAYILDKADSMDAVLDVEVTLNDDDPPVPCGVRITGSISPYSKEILSSFIANDLSIAKEDQIWM